MKKNILFSILFFSGNIGGMELQELKGKLEQKFFKTNQPSPPIQERLALEDISSEDFLAYVQKNNITVVKQCLNNQRFKDMIDARTLLTAYNCAKNLNEPDLRLYIHASLQKLFPLHCSKVTDKEKSDFQSALDANDSRAIDTFLNSTDFLDKVPIHILRTAQLKMRNKGNRDRCDNLRKIISQKRKYLQN